MGLAEALAVKRRQEEQGAPTDSGAHSRLWESATPRPTDATEEVMLGPGGQYGSPRVQAVTLDFFCGLPPVAADQLAADLLEKYSRNAEAPLKRRAKDPAAKVEIRQELQRALGQIPTPPGLIRDAFLDAVLDDITGYGPITPFMANPHVIEIMVNRPDQIVVDFIGRGMVDVAREMGVRFRSHAHIVTVLSGFAQSAGKPLDDSSPMVDLRTPEGHRLFGALAAVNRHGPSMTIRRRVIQMPTLDELERRGTMNRAVRRILETALQDKDVILMTGGTGSGKTTTLSALAVELGRVHPGSRFVTVEDPNEITLPAEYNWVAHEARPGNLDGRGEIPTRALVKVALRERPDFVIVGEVRGGEAFDLLQAWNTGHRGSPASLHANGPEEAVPRLTSMALMGMPEMPVPQIREMIGMAAPLLVHQERLADGRRVISRIGKVVAVGGDLTVVPVAAYDPGLDDWVFGADAQRLVRHGEPDPLARYRVVWEGATA